NLAKLLNAEHIKVEHKLFPDGESYIRVPYNVSNKEVAIVQSTYPPQDKHLIELLLMIEAVKNMNAAKIIAIVPYLAYARQDRRFKEGEALSIKTILSTLSHTGADTLVVVEPHRADALNYFHGDVIIIDPTPAIANYLKGIVKSPFILAPDRGALDRARRLAERLNAEYNYLEKFRDRETGKVEIRNIPQMDLNDKEVIIIDDIISTGGTVLEAVNVVRKFNVKRIIVVAAHALLVGDSYTKLKSAGVDMLITTNSVPTYKDVITVDISILIAEKL
ncbi:MAG: ribose-phosphate pyrophosphokinase, partial [Metallosphaera sp.]